MFFNFGHSSNCCSGNSTFLGGVSSSNCGCGEGNGMQTLSPYFGGGFTPSRCCGITTAYIPGPRGPIGPQGPIGPIGPQGAQGPVGPTEQVL